jgi:hypothetical protein
LGNQVETQARRIIKPKRPKLVLNKFKGNVTQWGSLWDSYKIAVHENTALASIDPAIAGSIPPKVAFFASVPG